jgi:hypothetical protein
LYRLFFIGPKTEFRDHWQSGGHNYFSVHFSPTESQNAQTV